MNMAQANPRPRRLNPCDRHPDIPTTTGLCAPCLRERLSLLTPSSAAPAEASTSSSSAAALPELRRCKTFSANNCESAVGLSFEHRRRSCDVRARSTLSNLFDLDDDGDGDGDNGGDSRQPFKVESRNLGLLSKGACSVPEVREEEEQTDESDCEIGVARVSDIPNNVDEFEESKTMKEFIDLECQANSNKASNRRDFKEIAGSFWVAASVFSKKLRKWKKKQGTRRNSGVGEHVFGRRSCDTDPRGSTDMGRASIDVDALGRRSSDSDPRFSIDLGRASVDCGRIVVDDPQCSFDAPRASWDGYLSGGRTLPRGGAPMVSVIENAMATVYGFDHRVLPESKMKLENRVQRDSNRIHQMKELGQRKSLDHCYFLQKETMVAEDEEPKLLSNAKVSPAAIDIFDGTKLLITERELREWRLNSLKDDSSESFETASKDLASVSSSSNGKVFKKCRQWSKFWSVWGLLHRRKGDKYGHEETLERGKEENPHTVSADNNRRSANEVAGLGPGPKLVRSHSTSSSRGSSSVSGSVIRMMGRTESEAFVRRRKEDVLERNRSARFSPNHLDNGLLRFYLTPTRSRKRTKSGNSRLKKSHSLARSVLRLY